MILGPPMLMRSFRLATGYDPGQHRAWVELRWHGRRFLLAPTVQIDMNLRYRARAPYCPGTGEIRVAVVAADLHSLRPCRYVPPSGAPPLDYVRSMELGNCWEEWSRNQSIGGPAVCCQMDSLCSTEPHRSRQEDWIVQVGPKSGLASPPFAQHLQILLPSPRPVHHKCRPCRLQVPPLELFLSDPTANASKWSKMVGAGNNLHPQRSPRGPSRIRKTERARAVEAPCPRSSQNRSGYFALVSLLAMAPLFSPLC